MTDNTAEPVAWKRDEPDSPCQAICIQHPSAGICIGCHRTPEEISDWASYTSEKRHQIRHELPDREALLRAAGARPSRRRRERRSA